MDRINPHLQIGLITDSGDIPSLYVRHAQSIGLTTLNHRLMHTYDATLESVAADADLLIVQRWLRTETRRMIEKAKERGIPIVYETDDNLFDLSEHTTSNFGTDLIDNMQYAMRAADLVTVSTSTIARALTRFNNNIIVVKNYGLEKPVNIHQDRPHLIIVNTDYFKLNKTKGAFFEAIDFAIRELGYAASFYGTIDPSMHKLAADYPSEVAIFQQQTNNHSAFLDLVASSGANVAVVPLEETEQHRYKSDIKYLDYGSLGIPGIYNNNIVYEDVVHLKNGFICKDSREGWVEGLRYFASAANRVSCGGAARDQIMAERSIAQYAQARTAIYAALLRGESGYSIAHASHVTSEKTALAFQQRGFFWKNGDLFVINRGKTHHVLTDSVIPSMLNKHALSYMKDETCGAEMLREGATLRSSADLDLLLVPTSERDTITKNDNPLSISWIVPRLLIGGGGHRNILRCAHHLERLGHTVSIYFIDTDEHEFTLRKQVLDHFYPIRGEIARFVAAKMSGDIVIPTFWRTVEFAEKVRENFKEIVYFVQDFEPSFYAMGSEYLLAEATYRKGYYAITSGRWCEMFLKEQFGAEADHFVFPVDRNIYFQNEQKRREDLVLFFAKPEMARRGFELGVAALEIFHRFRPDVEIGFYGSGLAANIELKFPVTHFGLLPGINDLADLYRKATVGLVFSTTNPSLVPYEMMACGLPVVDLARPGNEANYDGRYDIARLVDPEPSRMAAELVDLLAKPVERSQRSRAGAKFAESFPTEEEVALRVERLLLRRAEAWSASGAIQQHDVGNRSNAC